VLLQGFFCETHQRAGCLFQPASAMFQPASVVPRAHDRHCLRSVHLRRCSRAVEPPSLGPFEAIGASSLTCFERSSPSLRGTEGEVSATPIDRVVDCGFLVELLSGDSSGRPCPVR
jgi:hypothetical protein